MWAAVANAISASISAGMYSGMYKKLSEEPMSKFNWRTVDSNRITTKYEEIWLWDSELAVAIPWKTESKQLRNVNPAFTMWMPKISDSDPVPPILILSKAQAEARGQAIIDSHDDDCPF